MISLVRRRLPLLVLGLVVLLLALALSSIAIHFRELEILLQRGAYLEGGSGQTHMAAKFINQMKLFRNEVSQAEVDAQEVMMNLLLAQRARSGQELVLARNSFDGINIHLINGMRQMMGQPILPERSDLQIYADLETAFHLERIKEYKMALVFYEKTLREFPDLEFKQKGTIQLHRGFCYVLNGDTTTARSLFREVMTNHSNDDLGITASVLLSYLEAILRESRKVVGRDLDAARKLTTLMQCNEALQILDGLQPANAIQKAEAELLRGRCYEELQDKGRAVKSYTRAMSNSKFSTVASDANRRLFVLGSQNTEDKNNLMTTAINANKQIKDQNLNRLSQIVNQYSYESDSESSNFGKIPVISSDSIASAVQVVADLYQDEYENKAPLIKMPTKGSRVRVNIAGGKTLTGLLESNPGDKVVRLKTMIGVIGVERKDIRSIEKN
jgi:tetratricopeptide (TPR) repeat protein